MPHTFDSPSERDFRVRQAARTLIEAEEIKGNGKFMKDVKTELNRQSQAASKAASKSRK